MAKNIFPKIFDSGMIEENIKAYCFSVNIDVLVIDVNGDVLYQCGEAAAFCSFLQGVSGHKNLCWQEHLKGSKIAEKLGEEYVFACSAGLIHFVAPVIKQTSRIALVAGPILMDYPDDTMVGHIMTKHDLSIQDKGRIVAFLRELPVLEPDRVRYLSKLLFLTACSCMPDERHMLLEHSDISHQQSQIGESIHNLKAVRRHIPEVHTTCGLSNVSFGLPKRRLLNQAFAVAMATCGMDTFFIDPLDSRMMALLCGANAILGLDDYCCDYLNAFRQGRLE